MILAFWSTVALLLAGALLFVVPPMLRAPLRPQDERSPLAVYREQRAEADEELANGKLSPGQHARAILELQGRVIDEVGEPEPAAARPGRPAPLASILAVLLLVPAGAIGLYALLGKPAVLQDAGNPAVAASNAPHTMSREQMEEMVERLAEKLGRSPNDAEGWHMLGRSYVAFNRLPEAAQALDRASQLAPANANVLADYADTLAMLNGRKLEGRPMELVNAALKADPRHPKSLSLAGTAAFNRGDFAGAAATWQRLVAVLPAGSEQARSVEASIGAAQEQARQRGQATAPTAPAAAAPADEGIEGSVTLSDAFKSRVAPGATLFVFARAVEGPRMPLAIVRVPAAGFPLKFRLDDSSAMSPQLRLSGQAQVMLAARISRSGNATPQSGDLTGSIGPVKLGSREVRILIDGVTP